MCSGALPVDRFVSTWRDLIFLWQQSDILNFIKQQTDFYRFYQKIITAIPETGHKHFFFHNNLQNYRIVA
jgi:hypothetical protein